MNETLDPSIIKAVLSNGPLVGVLGYMAWAFYAERKKSDAKFQELSERGIKALENNNAALMELRRSNERVEAAVSHCPGTRHADHMAAMKSTQRMDRAI
jgi:hypothetical protein